MRFRLGISAQLAVLLTLLLIVLMGILTWLDIRQERAIFRQEMEERGGLLSTTLDDLVGDSLYFLDVDRLRDIMASVSSHQDVAYTRVYDREGKIVVDSIKGAYPLPAAPDELVEEALQTGGPLLRFEGDRLIVTNPVIVGRELLGTTQIGFTSDALDVKVAALRTQRVRETLTVVAGGILVSIVLASRVTKRLRELARAAIAIGRGDLAHRIRMGRNDEVGDLARALNHMAADLQADRRSIEGLNRSLEEKVRALETEITERERVEETIRHLAYHDALTDLPNRALFKDRLTLALAQARRSKQSLAVMFLDLDRFKVVNDTAGHAQGDKLLQSVGRQLKDLMREGDTVARVGGDEFTLLLPGITQGEDAIEIAQRILAASRQMRVVDGHEFHITTSIGIAMYPTDGEDAESLLRNADIALYRAKEEGRDNYALYSPAMNVQIAERLALENDLRHGLEREEFVVYYQPQVNISTGQVVGMEALVRWQHPERGLVLPMEFIPVAEETGLIVPLGEWVLRTACAQDKAWQEAGLPPLRVAVNLSARQFQQRNLTERVAQVLEETGLDPHWLQLEITEGVAMQDVDFTIKTLRDLKEMGVQIAIDDFGTGHSALSYLRRFPIDVVKIDRSFVCDLTTDASDAEIANTVIVMAHNLKLGVIAEGVETEEQLAFLKERRCDEMQGYLFSKPVPAEELEVILAQGKRLPVPSLGLKPR